MPHGTGPRLSRRRSLRVGRPTLAGVEHHVPAAQLVQLPEPQGTPGGQQDQRLLVLGHRGGELGQLGQAGRSDLVHPLGGRGAADHARVQADLPVAGGAAHDAAQQPVGVRSDGGGVGAEPGEPGPRLVAGDRRQRPGTELGNQVLVEDPAVVLAGAVLELAVGRPLLGVGHEGEPAGPQGGLRWVAGTVTVRGVFWVAANWQAQISVTRRKATR
jgi:hypothetical protein